MRRGFAADAPVLLRAAYLQSDGRAHRSGTRHAGASARRSLCGGRARSARRPLGRLGAGAGGAQPVGAVAAHRLDDRHQRAALLGQLRTRRAAGPPGRSGGRRCPPPRARAAAATACAARCPRASARARRSGSGPRRGRGSTSSVHLPQTMSAVRTDGTVGIRHGFRLRIAHYFRNEVRSTATRHCSLGDARTVTLAPVTAHDGLAPRPRCAPVAARPRARRTGRPRRAAGCR